MLVKFIAVRAGRSTILKVDGALTVGREEPTLLTARARILISWSFKRLKGGWASDIRFTAHDVASGSTPHSCKRIEVPFRDSISRMYSVRGEPPSSSGLLHERFAEQESREVSSKRTHFRLEGAILVSIRPSVENRLEPHLLLARTLKLYRRYGFIYRIKY